jgi:hypothetical protein
MNTEVWTETRIEGILFWYSLPEFQVYDQRQRRETSLEAMYEC